MIDLDIIGTLHADGAPLPGWHVNTSFAVAEWAAYKVTPATPRRVFGGHQTHFYTFADAAAFEAALATTDLDPPPATAVPKTITMRQARLVLSAVGLLATVKAAVAAAPESVQIEWEYAAELNRDWPTLQAMQGALGMTDAQVDALFVQGAAL